MNRKQAVPKAGSNSGPPVIAKDVFHGKFACHPLFVTLMSADVKPWREGLSFTSTDTDPERAEIIHQMGEWLYRVCCRGAADSAKEFKVLVKVIEHIAGKNSADPLALAAVREHTKQSIDSGMHPSLQSLKVGIRNGTKDSDGRSHPDNSTLRRNLKALCLPTFDEKSTKKVRENANKLSRGGLRKINSSELRTLLTKRRGKSASKLPETDAELIAVCVCVGAKVEKRQLFTAFHAMLAEREAGLVTDWAMASALPEAVMKTHQLQLRSAIRSYAVSIGLVVVESEECDRDDIFAKAPKQKVVTG